MVKFEVGGIYDNGARFVCVWRSNGKRPRAHFIEEWEHNMNLEFDDVDYALSREFDGMNIDNNVYPVHVHNDVEVSMWDGYDFMLSASTKCGNAKMKMTKAERKSAEEKREREESIRECKEFYSSIARGAGKGTYIAAKKSAGFIAKIVGAFAYIFSSKSTPRYSGIKDQKQAAFRR